MIPWEPIETKEEYDAQVKDTVIWIALIFCLVVSVIVFFFALLT